MNLKSKIRKFLSLPKTKNAPKRRIERQIERLKDEIEVVPTDFECETEKRCCGKVTFTTREDAEQCLKDSSSFKKNTKHPIRTYQCEVGNWHLSSVPLRFYRESAKRYT